MKTALKRMLAVILLTLTMPIALTISSGAASSGHPKGYWPYHVAYNEAVEKGNIDEILKKGDALLNFYSKYEINKDIAANSFNVYYYRYEHSIFEKRGDYAAAKENLEKLIYVSEIAGIADMDFITESKMRKINTRTGVFAAASDSSEAVYYGAKYEPRSGSYFGRVINSDGKNITKADELANESIASFYLEVGGDNAAAFDWIIKQADSKNRALMIALNYPKEGTTVNEINAGYHNSNIKSTLTYLATLDSPVFLRIGAEMNVWTIRTEPQAFINSYIKIAKMAREIAPNIALVFSVNSVGSYGDDMSLYYPGDEYVDWVGVSLYYNKYMNAATCEDIGDFSSMYFGIGDWAEPVASVAEAVELWGDRKPIMITEGGAGNYNRAKNMDLSEYAADKITRAYRTLNMVFPQIKGLIYFDTKTEDSHYIYSLDNSKQAQNAYNAATEANDTLIHHYGETAKTYLPINKFFERANTIDISAYCYAHYSGKVRVDYYLDGNLAKRADDAALSYKLDVSALKPGTHTLAAVFTNGGNFSETKKYYLIKYESGVVQFADFGDDFVHTHSLSAWDVNAATHSRACKCGYVEKSVHTWDSGVNNGFTIKRTCTGCGRVQETPLDGVGFYEVNGDKYYIKNNVTVIDVYIIIDNHIYYFGEDGKMQPDGKNDFSPEGYIKHDGFVEIGSETYYVKNDTVLYDYQVIDNRIYYFGDNGVMQKDTVNTFSAEGYITGNGFVNVGGNTYYIENNIVIYRYHIINNHIYNFGEDGICQGYLFGTRFTEIDGKTYFIHNDFIVTGYQIIDNHIYYFGDNGIMQEDGINTFGIDGYITSKTFKAANGANVVIYMVPNNGQRMKDLTVTFNGEVLTLSKLDYNKYSFVQPDGEVEINAEFVEISNSIVLTIGSKEADVFGNTFVNDVAPIIVKDRAMLGARFIAETLGATVEWNAEERKATITGADIVIVLYIDSTTAYVNGKEITLDSPAIIRDNRTYTPVRFVAEHLGATVEWSAATSQAIITK